VLNKYVIFSIKPVVLVDVCCSCVCDVFLFINVSTASLHWYHVQ